jgi:formic-like protein
MDEDSRRLGDADRCIVCLKALMNNSYGFNRVMQQPDSIKLITLSIHNESLKTRVLAFELLGAICLVGDGHRRILEAFDFYKDSFNERNRFMGLVEMLRKYSTSTGRAVIDFQIACMSLINVMVHSCEDLNLRVFLQGEFSMLGLDDIIERLSETEDEVLRGQLQAYRDNILDVGILQRGVNEAKAALKLAARLEDELQTLKERSEETANNLIQRIALLERELESVSAERDASRADNRVLLDKTESLERSIDLLNRALSIMKSSETERRMREQEARALSAQLKAHGLEDIPEAPMDSSGASHDDELGVPPPPAPPGMRQRMSVVSTMDSSAGNIPPPPDAPPPPPAPIAPEVPEAVREAKRVIHTNVPLPSVNWAPLRNTKNTIFDKIDDEKVLKDVSFGEFEEMFKTNLRSHEIQARLDRKISVMAGEQSTKKIQVVENNRARNVILARRRIPLSNEETMSAIEDLDLERLPGEFVDLLLKVLPTPEECIRLSEHASEAHNLAEADRFLLGISRIDRFEQKLQVMSYMSSFESEFQHVMPQIDAIIVAANAMRSSEKLVRLFEVVLAFGNYLNSSKRGGVYGFKVSSLDRLNDTRSNDKNVTLLQYIVKTVKHKYPDLLYFFRDLRFIDKAAAGALEDQ